MADETEDATIVDAPPGLRKEATKSERTDSAAAGATRSDEHDSGSTASHLGASIAQTSATATIAMREEQGARAKAFLRLACAVAALTFAALQTPVRAAPGYWAAVGGLGATVIAALWLLWDARHSNTVDPRKMNVFGLVCGYTILAAVFHVGIFSPAVVAMFVGVYYFGLGDSRFGAWAIYLMAAIGWGMLCMLAILGALPPEDPVFALKPPEPAPLISMVVVVEAFLALTFWLATASRRATLSAMDRVERAHRQIRQRDALLNEAKADLNRAMDVGRVGRFSDQPIGSYVVEEVIGRGAMGEVYRARHHDTNEPVAIKVLHHYMMEERTHVERFFREVRASGSAESPHIVRVLESGQAADGSPYLAMEYLEGNDLAHHLRESKRLGTKATLELVSHVADGLSAVQEAGVVHRDLKPQNIFRAKSEPGDRVWKILDFGVATIGAAGGTLTQGAAIGTPSYMAPEQARGEAVDHRADVFALGVIAYRSLTGRPAFTGPDSMSTMYNVVHVQPVKPSDLVKLHEDVDRVLALVLAKAPGRRFSSASTFSAALRDAARGGLDDRFRRDADELLQAHPWGSDDTKAPGATE